MVSIVIYVIGIGIYSYWSNHHAEKEIMANIDNRLLLAAKSLKYMLQPDFHDRALEKTSITFEEELKNRKALSNFTFESEFAWLYTLVEKDGKYFFTAPTVTAAEAKEQKRWYFFQYDDIPKEFVNAYENNEITFVVYSDQWGNFRSVAVPQVSPGGRRYLSCADFDITYIGAILRKNLWESVLTALFFCILTIPFIFSYMVYNEELKKTNKELRGHKNHLERLVEERTNNLRIAKEKAEELKEKAQSANIAKTQFLANMSHELRTPMHGVLGFAKLGIKKGPELKTDKIINYFEKIYSCGNKLLYLLNNLLDISRLESGKTKYKFADVSLLEVVQTVSSELQAIIDEKQITIEVKQIGCCHQTYMDFDKILQVARNLFSNAIKFSDSKSKIEICIEENKDDSVLAVIDSGMGIPEIELESIFDKFVQSSKTGTNAGGTGLGLAICKQIIEDHGGVIWAENNPKGGATIQFRIPNRRQN